MTLTSTVPATVLAILAGTVPATSPAHAPGTNAARPASSVVVTPRTTWVQGHYLTHRDCEAVGEQGLAAGDWDYYTCTLSRTRPHPTWALVVSESS
jgi:hypothetical protein